jgi:hypothetical protein
MYHAEKAEHRSTVNRQGCLMGTRVDDLQQKLKIGWRTSKANAYSGSTASRDRKVNHRPDGCRDYLCRGKTCRQFLLLARFRGQEGHSSNLPNACISTRISVPRFREQLLQVLKANGIGRQTFCSQLEKMIVGPLKAAHIPTVIVIYALDECQTRIRVPHFSPCSPAI